MSNAETKRILLECLADNYGLAGHLQRLPGENLNYLLLDKRNKKHVIKIVDEHQPPDVVAMEFAVIEHAIAAGFVPRLPRIKENKYGNIETGIKLHKKSIYRIRIIEFLSGKGMSDISDISDLLLRNLGQAVAEFDRALVDFDIPAAHRNHRWNLAEADQHEDKIALIDDPGKQDLLQWAYAGFHAVRPRLAALPHQVIHGDAHDENVLVEGDRVCGLIDFGDCCYNPTVNDLAICLTYLMMRRDDPLEVADLVIAGYQAVRALTDEELDLLYPLICARLAVSVCIANKRKTIDPDNPNWFGGENAAWRLLAWLRRAGPDVFTARTKAGL